MLVFTPALRPYIYTSFSSNCVLFAHFAAAQEMDLSAIIHSWRMFTLSLQDRLLLSRDVCVRSETAAGTVSFWSRAVCFGFTLSVKFVKGTLRSVRSAGLQEERTHRDTVCRRSKEAGTVKRRQTARLRLWHYLCAKILTETVVRSLIKDVTDQ